MNNLGRLKIVHHPTSSKVQGSGSQTLPVDRALQSERPMTQRLGPMVGLVDYRKWIGVKLCKGPSTYNCVPWEAFNWEKNKSEVFGFRFPGVVLKPTVQGSSNRNEELCQETAKALVGTSQDISLWLGGNIWGMGPMYVNRKSVMTFPSESLSGWWVICACAFLYICSVDAILTCSRCVY